MKDRKNQKGTLAILIAFAFVSLILAYTCAGLYVNSNMRQTRLDLARIEAYRAALAGIEYAKSRIEANYTWEGNGYGVRKDAGGVITDIQENYNGLKQVKGETTNKNIGKTASFYISFDADNYNPGFNKYISYNNMGKPRVTNAAHSTKSAVPADAVLITSKGECQNQIVYAEAGFTRSGVEGVSAPAIASERIDITMSGASPKFTVDANGLLEPKICSNKQNDSAAEPSVSIKDGVNSPDFAVDFNGGGVVTWGKNTRVPPGVNVKIDTKTNVAELSIDQVISRLSVVNGNVPANLKAGAYSFIYDNGQYKLRYNAGSEVKTYIAGAGGVPEQEGNSVNKLPGMKMDAAAPKLYITSPQKVETANGVNFLTIQGEGSLNSRIKVVEENQAYLLNSLPDGNITVRGEISGDGAVVSKGDITFEGKSVMNTKADAGVSIFADGNVNLNPIPPNVPDPDVPLETARGTEYQTKFIALGNAFSGYLKDSPPSLLYRNLKDNLKTSTIPTLNSKDTNSRRSAIQGFKASAEQSGAIPLNSKDYNLFRAWLANGFNFSQTDAVFYGLIYARGDFNCAIDGTFTLIGSMIINGAPPYGKIYFTNAKGIYLIYDSSYLGIFMELFNTCSLSRMYENKL